MGPFWAMLGHFVSCLGNFGLFWALFRPCKAFPKYTVNTTKNTLFDHLADGLCSFFFLAIFVALFLDMLHLGYACLISGFCWVILGYFSALLGSC